MNNRLIECIRQDIGAPAELLQIWQDNTDIEVKSNISAGRALPYLAVVKSAKAKSVNIITVSVKGVSSSRIFSQTYNDLIKSTEINIILLRVYESQAEELIDIFKKKFNTHPTINRLLRKTSSIFGLMWDENKKTFICFLQETRSKETATLALAINKLLENKEIDPAENDLLYDLTKALNDNKSNEDIRSILIEYLQKTTDFDIDLNKQVKKLLEAQRKEKISNLEDEITNARTRIQGLMHQLTSCQSDLEEKLISLSGLKMSFEEDKISQNIYDGLNLLKTSKDVLEYDVYADMKRLTFRIKKALEVNDEEHMKKVINYTRERELIEDANVLEAVLIKKIAKLYTQAPIDLYISDRISLQGRSVVANGDDGVLIPHPHLVGYNCFGQYSSMIMEAGQKGDLLMIIELCLNAVEGLNAFDSPVIDKLLEYMRLFDDRKCIEYNNEMISIQDFRRVLHEINKTETAN